MKSGSSLLLKEYVASNWQGADKGLLNENIMARPSGDVVGNGDHALRSATLEPADHSLPGVSWPKWWRVSAAGRPTTSVRLPVTHSRVDTIRTRLVRLDDAVHVTAPRPRERTTFKPSQYTKHLSSEPDLGGEPGPVLALVESHRLVANVPDRFY